MIRVYLALLTALSLAVFLGVENSYTIESSLAGSSEGMHFTQGVTLSVLLVVHLLWYQGTCSELAAIYVIPYTNGQS